MSRPAKPIDLAYGARTNEEKKKRAKAEAALKGKRPVKIPDGLSRQQRAIAKDIIESLDQSELLCGMDETIIALAAYSIDGIRACINEQNKAAKAIADGDMEAELECMNDPNFRAKLKKYEETFDRACKELGLSPQSRAKLAIAGTTGKDSSLDAIKQIIGGGKAV
ncbi:MAG: P27 family phage terminase small subunit [Oscillospiraceae bacterium]|nr:P27 family phage terminase small subunit [Oscillospiraceae bacterium]